jgi:hypothetical protein
VTATIEKDKTTTCLQVRTDWTTQPRPLALLLLLVVDGPYVVDCELLVGARVCACIITLLSWSRRQNSLKHAYCNTHHLATICAARSLLLCCVSQLAWSSSLSVCCVAVWLCSQAEANASLVHSVAPFGNRHITQLSGAFELLRPNVKDILYTLEVQSHTPQRRSCNEALRVNCVAAIAWCSHCFCIDSC